MTINKYAGWVSMSLEDRADAGMELTAEERAVLAQRDADIERWRAESRRWPNRFRAWRVERRERLSLAWNVLRNGHECEE